MKRVVFIMSIVSIYLFSCSESNYCNTSDVNYVKTPRHIELLKIMRAEEINKRENSDFLTVKERRELKKAKKDFNYLPDTYYFPGPCWDIKGPLDLTVFLEELKGIFNKDYEMEQLLKKEGRKGSLNEFVQTYRDGDEIYHYKSDKNSWAELAGCEGYILIRKNKIILNLVLTIS